MTEHSFETWDGVRLFYRLWRPDQPAQRALVLFHRGHEHSGRFEDTVDKLGLHDMLIAAWDARGHGRSPGDRGWAPNFACLVRDADCFVRHVSSEHGVPVNRMAVLAHSIGAVVASTWVHDYAPPIRALILASPAFRVKLYVPFALHFLRLRLKFQPQCYVQSYVRPSMLTHDEAECKAYAADPLIARAVAVNLLVDMHDTATRIIDDAAAIRTPVLLLCSGSDYVVKLNPQREFFHRLGSPEKAIEVYPKFFHDLLHERERERPIARAREFLLKAFERPVEAAASNEETYTNLTRPPSAIPALLWKAQRLFLRTVGRLSRGIDTGWRYGFDSGESLDYVYRNQPQGANPLGVLIDRIYLGSPGWTGIRQRRAHLESLLAEAVASVQAANIPVRIFDPAAGGGRYILETLSRLNGAPVSAVLRDWSLSNVDAAAALARALNLKHVTVAQGDAFDRSSLAAVTPRPNVAVVSGLYELFPDNASVSASLNGIADAMDEGGFLLYTNQPWHPQLEMIARVLDNREGKPWVMRCRSQAEMDALVRDAGFEKLRMLVDADGIFTVTLARRSSSRANLTSC